MHLYARLYVAKFSGHSSTLICKKGVVNDEFKGSHKNQCRKAMSCLLPNAHATFGENSCFSDPEIPRNSIQNFFWIIEEFWCHMQMSEQKSLKTLNNW